MPFALPAGKLLSYIDGQFGSESFLNSTYANEPFSLVLGNDKLISANYERKITQSSEQDLETVILDRHTLLTNHHSYAIDVRVHQQIPRSQHKDIQIISPVSEVDEKGFYTQIVHLKPQERKQLDQKIKIQYPSKLPVRGLNW